MVDSVQPRKEKAMTWYKTGDEGAEAAKQEDERRQSQFSDKVQRFWLAPDKSTKVLFLDSTGLN